VGPFQPVFETTLEWLITLTPGWYNMSPLKSSCDVTRISERYKLCRPESGCRPRAERGREEAEQHRNRNRRLLRTSRPKRGGVGAAGRMDGRNVAGKHQNLWTLFTMFNCSRRGDMVTLPSIKSTTGDRNKYRRRQRQKKC